MQDMRNNPARQNEYLLEVDNLVKWFPIKSSFFKRTIGNVKAVDGVSFRIRRGETMGNQFILKEISPGISLEGMMLKLKLQYFATSCEELTHWKRL